MKRMSEVFELPVKSSIFEVSGYIPAKEVNIENGVEADEYAAHAINHVDALADALEIMLSENSTMSKWLSDNYWDAEDSENFKKAKKALASYRGDK